MSSKVGVCLAVADALELPSLRRCGIRGQRSRSRSSRSSTVDTRLLQGLRLLQLRTCALQPIQTSTAQRRPCRTFLRRLRRRGTPRDCPSVVGRAARARYTPSRRFVGISSAIGACESCSNARASSDQCDCSCSCIVDEIARNMCCPVCQKTFMVRLHVEL